jgi:YbbR domain-containing protein
LSKEPLRVRIPTLNLSRKIRVTDFFRRMRRNAGLRIISLMIAVGLWIFVNAGQRGAVENVSVPISYRSLPPGLVIVNHPPDFVKIEVSGPRTLLSLLDPERLTVKLDLGNMPTGRSDLKLSPSMFNVPRQTNVSRITPDEVHVDVDRIVARELPIHLDIDGHPAPNYQINSVELKPAMVSVSGPSRYVMPLQNVDTEPIELKGETSDLDARLALQSPNNNVHVGADRVQVHLDIGEVIANKEFKGVPVEVRDTDFKTRVSPQKATITLRGPVGKLDGLDPKGLVYVDAKGGDPGARELPLQVDLPEGMQLVKQAPDRVRLRIYREKRTDLNDGKTS